MVHPSRRVTFLALTLLCAATAFALGSKTSGSVRTVESTSALDGRLPGDINADQSVNVADAVIVLETVNGYREATAKELLGDPNEDGQLTVEDALSILRTTATVPLN